MSEERWLPIPGHDGYEASNLGGVRSVDRVVVYKDGRKFRKNGRVLSVTDNGRGYRVIVLPPKVPCYAHRLVLEAFVGPCPDGMEACHNDGDQSNNRLENLRWDVKKANHADKRLHGTLPLGEMHYRAKLTESDVLEIRRRAAAGEKSRSIAKDFGMTHAPIFDIVRRKNWKHV
jgi:hypothetical protein